MKNLLKKLNMVQDEEPKSNTDSMDQSLRPAVDFSGLLTSVAMQNTYATATDATSVSSNVPLNLESETKDYAVDECRQVQMAIELSAREDPEAVQIEAVKQISLGSCSLRDSSPADVLAYRYWNYNALSIDDKILDGFYDFCSVSSKYSTSKLPSLADLKETPLTDHIVWEAILVNRTEDPDLSKLEQKALMIASESKFGSLGFPGKFHVQKIAIMVSNYMGGAVGACDNTSNTWNRYKNNLRKTINSNVLPLGRLTIGLARHRALLFKVLADSVGIPCQILKGKQYTGSDDGAMNIVRLAEGREWIVDLMIDPGTLVLSDTCGTQKEYINDIFELSPLVEEYESSYNISISTSSSSTISSLNFESNRNTLEIATEDSLTELSNPKSKGYNKPHDHKVLLSHDALSKPKYPLQTEAITSIELETKVKDVSLYMIDATKENPQLAQKLYDVLLESGVAVPSNLFDETCIDNQETLISKGKKEVNADEKTNLRENLGMSLNILPDNNLNPKSTHPELPCINHPKPIQSQRIRDTEDEELKVQKPAFPRKLLDSVIVASAIAVSNAEGIVDPIAAASDTAMAVSVVSTNSVVGTQHEHAAISNCSCRELACSESHECSFNDEPETSNKSERSVVEVNSDALLEEVVEFGIPWEELILGERIGMGSYGEVYYGEWHGTEVAVKKLLEQELSNDGLEEFMTEVMIMKKLRHPNVVLFMGVVTHVPNLSIVTEFLPRGSLFGLIRRSNNQLNLKRRLKMALDVARGMNYLHSCSPVIVHRDLKSPNLLVDKNFVVKVGDFGLSRIKKNTFLSSRSTVGSAEWMAPEVLRNELSDEKCDVYSFGVILWELCTLQVPWEGMNLMQVVGAVGYQNRRLDIPNNMDPRVSEIIIRCWKTDPKERPSFYEIIAMLKSLQKPMNVSRSHRHSSKE